MNLNTMKENLKANARKAKEDAANAARKTWNFVSENRDTIVLLAPIAIAGVRQVNRTIRSANRNQALKIENKKRNQVYDRSAGEYIDVKWSSDPATRAAQKAEFARRVANGEKRIHVLIGMGLV